MKIKVISENVIHGGEIFGIGSVIDDIDKFNAERLCKCGICEVIGGKEKDLDEMKKAELIAYAESIGVEVDENMKKAEIIEAIENADVPATDIP